MHSFLLKHIRQNSTPDKAVYSRTDERATALQSWSSQDAPLTTAQELPSTHTRGEAQTDPASVVCVVNKTNRLRKNASVMRYTTYSTMENTISCTYLYKAIFLEENCVLILQYTYVKVKDA